MTRAAGGASGPGATDDGRHVLAYSGDASVDAERLVVLLDGDRSERQWADEYDTVTDGDRLELDAEAGGRLRVEYETDQGRLHVTSETLPPAADVEVTYDVDSQTVTATHRGGVELAADALQVVAAVEDDRGIREFDAWPDRETVAPGDSFEVELSDLGGPVQAAAVLYEERPLVEWRREGEEPPR